MTALLASLNPMSNRMKFGSRSVGRRAFLAAVLLAAAGPATATTFVVNNRFDAGTGGCTSGECTLREALVAANAGSDPDSINFSFRALAGPEILIQPTTPLPTITQPVTINGYSVTGSAANTDPVASNAVIRIRVDGASLVAGNFLFDICANNTTLRGLSITRMTAGNGFGVNVCASVSSGVVVAGNFIGLASDGSTAAGNRSGILASGPVTIGGTSAADRNVIAGQLAGHGIVLQTTPGSAVLGNLVGTDRSGVLDRGNGLSGIQIGNTVGTVGSVAAPNRIAFNGRGVTVASTVGNRVFSNHYGPNDELGIDLQDSNGGFGVSLNDTGDGDGGGNGQQNYLDEGFTADRTPTGINIQGTLRRSAVAAPITFTIAAYATPVCDASGHGEGEQFLGTATEATISGTAPINVDIPLATQPPPGSFITTTVTSPDGSTSEFSTCAPLDPPPLVVNSTNDVADGQCDATHCSLRDALAAANADAGPSVIHFDIASPVSGELMIQPTAVLPTITAPVLIDGYSQAGTSVNTDPEASNAVLRIRLDGAIIGANANGLGVCANDTTIRGLSITRFSRRGIGVGADASDSGVCNTNGTGSRIGGNFIGVASNGSTAAGNALAGVSSHNASATFGGSALEDRNVISSNAQDGVLISGSAGANQSQVLNNLIGTDSGGTLDRGNGRAGVTLSTSGASVGAIGARNRIAFNLRGISVTGAGSTGRMFANEVFSNDNLGIDLNGDGLTPNDVLPDDTDNGPNGLQNFPVITKAERSAAGIAISGTLDVKAGTSNVPYTIGVYANGECDASGHGEGERLLGAATVNLTQTTGESFSFELSTDDPLEAGVQITSTATGPEGSSEFSACVAATDAPPGIAVNSVADPGAGTCNGTDECTLRQAITLANTQPGADLIRFAIPGDGPHEIVLASLLPVISEAVTIDGYTQAGASPNAAEDGSDAVLKIEVDGQGRHLLRTCTTGAVEVRGLALVGADIAVDTSSFDVNCAVVGSLIFKGNFVGLRADGTAAGNFVGVRIENTVATIGTSEKADRNILSGNQTSAVFIVGVGASGSTVQNNLIGTAASPDVNRGNGGAGVDIAATFNVMIGGEDGQANLIAFNGRGVQLRTAGTGHRLYANQFVRNDGIGIDVSGGDAGSGVTPNDDDDTDSGPNNVQNFPVLGAGSATTTSITINGTLDVPDTVVAPLGYTIAFYESAACDDSGNGEGEIYLGSRQVNFTDSAQGFSETLAIPPAAGASVITATATDPQGNTSEFSNCLAGPQPVQIFADGFEG